MDYVKLAVNGTLMRGLELEGNMLNAGAVFEREDRTEKKYRLWSIHDNNPAMIRVTDGDENAVCVDVEIWKVPLAGLASILLKEPAGLSIGKVRLYGGEEVFGVIAEPVLLIGMKEISEYGGWRSYLSSKKQKEE